MSNKRNFRKYTVTTMAAAAAVASVAPIAISADTTKGFTDVNLNHNAYDEIMDLSELGIITGKDGAFMPSQDIKRVQAANMILRSLNAVDAPVDVPQDIAGTLKDLVDVKADNEYAEEIASVVAAGIIKGNQKNQFKPWGPITREQMASTLVRAFDLEDYDNGEKVNIDLKGVDESHKGNVQTLANLGITQGTALNNFNPIDPITRAQFSVMVHRTLDVVNANADVRTVSAVPTAIKEEANQQLAIHVNNGTEVTVEQLNEAGYEVEFNYNKTGAAYNKATGVVDGSTASTTFKYQVVLTPDEGEAIKSDWTDVNVLNAQTPTKVTKVGLSTELSYVTLGEEVTVDVLNAVNAFGDEVETGDLPAIASIESSDPTVAYVSDTNKINPRKEGSVVFTINFNKGLNLDPVTLSVDVKAAQKASAIEAENVKVEADIEYEYNYGVLDQYGEEMRTTVDTIDVVTNSEGQEVIAPGAFGTEGTYTVTVYAKDTSKDNDLGEKLGSFTVTTVDAVSGEVDEFTLATEKDFEIDLNPDLVDEDGESVDKSTGKLSVEAFIDGVKISDVASKLVDDVNLKYELRTSNADVVTIDGNEKASAEAENTLQGESAGTAKISLVKVEGDLVTVLATYDVTVKNSTKKINAVDFKEDIEEVTINGTTEEALKAAVVKATNLKEKHIEKVEYAASDRSLIVTINAMYGGEEFLLPASKAPFTVAVDEKTLTLTFSEVANVADISGTLNDGTATKAVVEEDETNTYTITFEEDIKAEDTITVTVKDSNYEVEEESGSWTVTAKKKQ